VRCRPAQSDRGEEMNSCRRAERHHHHHDRPGHPHHSSPRSDAAALLWGRRRSLIGRYSSGPLVGPRPVTAWPAGHRAVVRWLGHKHI
jgi:hypothetical protein